jgi:hypothetical protein
MDEPEDGDWHAVDAIKHRLLFCHSIAFDDPLGEIVSLAASQMRLGNQGDGGKRALLNYINLLLHFSELLRTHVVCVVPPEAYLPGHTAPTYVPLDANLQMDLQDWQQQLDFDEIMQAAPENVQVEWKTLLKEADGNALLQKVNFVRACERISSAIAGVSHAPRKLSLYLPFRYDVDLLKKYRGSAIAPGSFSLPDRDNWLLNQLVDVKLPGLSSLSPHDLVAIRTGAEFGQWRKVLKEALRNADALPDDLWNREQEVRKEIDDRLQEGKVQLEAAISKSRVLDGVKQGSVSMLAGLASVGLTLLLNPAALLAVLVAAAGAAATVQAIAAAVKGSTGSTTSSRGALAHYVAVLR